MSKQEAIEQAAKEKQEVFREGREYEGLLDSTWWICGEVRRATTAYLYKPNFDKLEGYCIEHLRAFKRVFEKMRAIEQKYSLENLSINHLKQFVEEHGKLCEWLASQKPWGQK